MTKTSKKFDCVEMKNEVQAALLKEYEGRKKEFDSFTDFLSTKSEESKWQQGFLAKIAKAKLKKTA